MEKYFKRKSTSNSDVLIEIENSPTPLGSSVKKRFFKVDLKNLPTDPGKMNKISCYYPNDQDDIRRAYLQKGHCQPRVRGQGYDGTSNMLVEFNGLKSLILKENNSAFYVRCFAHQLQLTLVAVAKKKQVDIGCFFSLVNNSSNVVGASCKRRDILRESQILKVNEALNNGEISSGSGLNQETTLKRAGDTRWGSNYGTLLSLISLFTPVIDVLESIEEHGISSEQRIEACHLLKSMQCFEFLFKLHIMRNILGITNELSQALQSSDQDIVNAIALVRVCRKIAKHER